MKYRYKFVTYNIVDVDESEAKNEDEAYVIAEKRFHEVCDPLWDEFTMEKVYTSELSVDFTHNENYYSEFNLMTAIAKVLKDNGLRLEGYDFISKEV